MFGRGAAQTRQLLLISHLKHGAWRANVRDRRGTVLYEKPFDQDVGAGRLR